MYSKYSGKFLQLRVYFTVTTWNVLCYLKYRIINFLLKLEKHIYLVIFKIYICDITNKIIIKNLFKKK